MKSMSDSSKRPNTGSSSVHKKVDFGNFRDLDTSDQRSRSKREKSSYVSLESLFTKEPGKDGSNPILISDSETDSVAEVGVETKSKVKGDGVEFKKRDEKLKKQKKLENKDGVSKKGMEKARRWSNVITQAYTNVREGISTFFNPSPSSKPYPEVQLKKVDPFPNSPSMVNAENIPYVEGFDDSVDSLVPDDSLTFKCKKCGKTFELGDNTTGYCDGCYVLQGYEDAWNWLFGLPCLNVAVLHAKEPGCQNENCNFCRRFKRNHKSMPGQNDIINHFKGIPYYCYMCGMKMPFKSYFSAFIPGRRICNHCAGYRDWMPTHKCYYCQKYFPKVCLHRRNHNKTTIFMCPTCFILFSTEEQLKEFYSAFCFRVLVPFECCECGKTSLDGKGFQPNKNRTGYWCAACYKARTGSHPGPRSQKGIKDSKAEEQRIEWTGTEKCRDCGVKFPILKGKLCIGCKMVRTRGQFSDLDKANALILKAHLICAKCGRTCSKKWYYDNGQLTCDICHPSIDKVLQPDDSHLLAAIKKIQGFSDGIKRINPALDSNVTGKVCDKPEKKLSMTERQQRQDIDFFLNWLQLPLNFQSIRPLDPVMYMDQTFPNFNHKHFKAFVWSMARGHNCFGTSTNSIRDSRWLFEMSQRWKPFQQAVYYSASCQCLHIYDKSKCKDAGVELWSAVQKSWLQGLSNGFGHYYQVRNPVMMRFLLVECTAMSIAVMANPGDQPVTWTIQHCAQMYNQLVKMHKDICISENICQTQNKSKPDGADIRYPYLDLIKEKENLTEDDLHYITELHVTLAVIGVGSRATHIDEYPVDNYTQSHNPRHFILGCPMKLKVINTTSYRWTQISDLLKNESSVQLRKIAKSLLIEITKFQDDDLEKYDTILKYGAIHFINYFILRDTKFDYNQSFQRLLRIMDTSGEWIDDQLVRPWVITVLIDSALASRWENWLKRVKKTAKWKCPRVLDEMGIAY